MKEQIDSFSVISTPGRLQTDPDILMEKYI